MADYVVGIDPSDRSAAALAWALEDAGDDNEVIAVHVWAPPVILGPEAAAIDPSVFEEEGQEVLSTQLDRLEQDHPGAADRIQTELHRGHAGRSLVERAGGHDVLVVGARGHGGVAGMLLGSTSTYAVHHARCPVVVVPVDR